MKYTIPPVKRLLATALLMAVAVAQLYSQAETQNPLFPLWKLKGNSGTTAGTHFVGTTDAADLVFKTFNQSRMTISAAGFAAINASPTANDYLYVGSTTKGPNLTNIYAYNSGNSNGTGWDLPGVAANIKAYCATGNIYSAAIAGYSYQDFAGSAAVVGANQDGTGAGFLGYYNGTTRYGVYTTGTVPASIGGNLEFYKALMPNGLAGTAGQVLTSSGAGVAPIWASAAGGGVPWQITGNSGIIATNFMGTTDDADVIFKRNNVEALRIKTGGALLATGDSATGVTPTSGFGTRLMWIPQKSAFRAGFVSGTQWDNANIGMNSFAAGKNTIASGQSSFAAGETNFATGAGSVALGQFDTVVSTQGGLAIGYSNHVSGQHSFAWGQQQQLPYDYSMVGGFNCMALGHYATAVGYLDTVGTGASSFGYRNGAIGDYSHAVGNLNRATGIASVSMGEYNRASAQAAFASGESNISSGISSITIGQLNTSSGLGATALGTSNTVAGQYSLAFGQQCSLPYDYSLLGGYISVSLGHYSTAVGYTDTAGTGAASFGYKNGATGNYSYAVGNTNRATGISSVAMGQLNKASGQGAMAIGESNIASGNYSFAVGTLDTANGNNSQVMGVGNYSYSYGELVAGSYATRYVPNNATGFDRRDRIFNIGNGTATASRSDAFTILKNGRTGFNTNAPAARADVNGDIALRQKTLSLATGANNDVSSVDTMSFYKITGPAGAFSISGLTGGVDGRMVILYNASGQNMTITHLSTSSAANQINTMSGNLVTTGDGFVTMIYDAGSSKWIVLSFNP